MPDPAENPHTAPLPPVAHPSPLPGIFSVVIALAAGAERFLRGGGPRNAALSFAAAGCGFFLGRRIGGGRAGVLAAAGLAALTAGFSLGGRALLANFLLVVGLWWMLRFRDDRAPANGLVTLAAFIALGWLVVRGGW